MEIHELPIEIILHTIEKLDYIDILNLYRVSKFFKKIIEENSYGIYLLLRNKSCGLLVFNREIFNFRKFSKIYCDTIKKKKTALIIISYIHKWINNELIDSPMDRSFVPQSMGQAIHEFLIKLFPEKKYNIQDRMDYLFAIRNTDQRVICYANHRELKKIIEEYVSEDLLNYINMSRIIVSGFKIYETFDFKFPKINIYNKDFTYYSKYKIKINECDTKFFRIT